MLGRGFADDQRQMAEARHVSGIDHGADTIDHLNALLMLPQRERLALDDLDADGVGQAALDGGALDPIEGEQPRARRVRREVENRVAALDAERGQDGGRFRFAVAGAVDILDRHAETGGGGHEGVARTGAKLARIAGLNQPPACHRESDNGGR